jgi:GMP synthase (glutamine-hydrolysing)
VRILHVEHPDGEGPGVFADVAGFETWRAFEQPAPDGEVDAIVLYGASSNVVDRDRERWIADEIAWLRERLDAGVPTLGLCFGAQMIAAARDAAVTRCVTPEIGWHPVELTAAGRHDPVIGALPGSFDACQWHSWRFDVPDGAELLATSAAGPQAFRLGSAWGVQFHPEVDAGTLGRWIDGYDNDPDAVAQGFDPASARTEMDRRIRGWNALGRDLFSAFLTAVR